MELVDINYNEFISKFEEHNCIRTRENTKQETIVRIGIWNDKQVALKTCYRKREVILYSKIKPHRNIVRLLSIVYQTIPEKEKPRVYVLMEANSGINLGDTIQYRYYNYLETLHIMVEIAGGLEHLHSCGIIHHDIKMSNILAIEDDLNSTNDDESLNDDDESISYDEQSCLDSSDDDIPDNIVYKICDFGISEYIDNNGHGSEKHRNCGTKPYMPPEKTKECTIALTTKVDIFAMGVLGSKIIDPDLSSTAIDKYKSIMNICQSTDPDKRSTADQLLEQLLLLQVQAQQKILEQKMLKLQYKY